MALGKILREARERRQLSLSQVAAATRMKVQVAQALEAEDYRKLPAPIYGRGFIRMYAAFVGVDSKPLIEEYNAAISAPPEQPQPGGAPPAPAQTGQPRVRPPAFPTSARPKPQTPAQAATAKAEPAGRAGAPPPAAPATLPEPEPVREPVAPPVQESAPEPAQEIATAPVREQPAWQQSPRTASEDVRREDDLFAWGQNTTPADAPAGTTQAAAAQIPQEPAPEEAPAPRPAEPTGGADEPRKAEPEPAAPAQADAVPPTEPVVEPASPQTDAPAQAPQPFAAAEEKPAGDLFVAGPALARPPKTNLGTYQQQPRHLSHRPGSESTLSSEREALKWRAAMVIVGVVVVTILLISALSRCSAPPKEVKRGPVKERLKLAVEPPAPYVD
jgi:hypothetical protein